MSTTVTILDLFLSSALAMTPNFGDPAIIVTQQIADNPDALELVVIAKVDPDVCPFVVDLIHEYQPEYTAWCTDTLLEDS